MKKTMELLDNYDPSHFKPKCEIGIVIPPTVLKSPNNTTHHIYTVDDKSDIRMTIGTDGDVLIAHLEHDGSYYKVYEGIQNALYLTITEVLKKRKSHP